MILLRIDVKRLLGTSVDRKVSLVGIVHLLKLARCAPVAAHLGELVFRWAGLGEVEIETAGEFAVSGITIRRIGLLAGLEIRVVGSRVVGEAVERVMDHGWRWGGEREIADP